MKRMIKFLLCCCLICSVLVSSANDPTYVVSNAEDIDFIEADTTLGEIKQRLSPDYEFVFVQNYMVDMSAILVQKDNRTIFAILTDTVKMPADTNTFSTIIIDSPGMTTPEGIGVGSLISDASHVYGPVELSYNVENESREFATFINGPEDFLFRTGSADEAGVYKPNEYTTTHYKKDAKINMLMKLLR